MVSSDGKQFVLKIVRVDISRMSKIHIVVIKYCEGKDIFSFFRSIKKHPDFTGCDLFRLIEPV